MSGTDRIGEGDETVGIRLDFPFLPQRQQLKEFPNCSYQGDITHRTKTQQRQRGEKARKISVSFFSKT